MNWTFLYKILIKIYWNPMSLYLSISLLKNCFFLSKSDDEEEVVVVESVVYEADQNSSTIGHIILSNL